MKIGVIGTGYVGLVVGACLADHGNTVTCVDVAPEKIEQLNRGEVPFYEPGLSALISRNTEGGRLSFTTDVADAVRRSQIIYIAVGTPENVDGSTSLRFVFRAAEDIGQAMNGPKIIVVKSTVPVGTCDKIAALIAEHTTHPAHMVMNPEFLSQGSAVDDFMKPQRIIIGSNDDTSKQALSRLYAPLMRTNNRMLLMDIRSAELAKYASNIMLAVRISVMNDLANLCEKVGADVEQVRRGVAMDSRIGSKFLFPGVGYGGSCFPKDMQALIATAKEHGHPLEILEAAERVNDRQRRLLATKVLQHFNDDIDGLRIAVWGLSFKPNTDDMREAPSTVIIKELLRRNAEVVAYDPKAIPTAQTILRDRVTYAESPMGAIEGAAALLIVTEWNEFRSPDLDELKAKMAQPVVFDGRNLFDPTQMREAGFTYYAIGRP